MPLSRLWAGRAYGTNTGNLFVQLEGEDAALTGTLRLNEPGVAIVVYDITGSFDGTELSITGVPRAQIEGLVLGQLTASARLDSKGELHGTWETNIGSAGTFILYPHGSPGAAAQAGQVPDQLHTARHPFGAIGIDREQIVEIGEELQREFINGRVVVTVLAGSEQSRYLEDFKNLKFNADRAEAIKLFVQEPEAGSTNKVVTVEFGPQFNFAMAQSASEAWTLGKLEKLKRDLRRFERAYTTNFKKFNFGINQLLLVGAIIYLPSLNGVRDRTILMVGVFAITHVVTWLHTRYLPFAAIYLRQKPIGMFARVAPSAVSWIIAATAGAAATLLAAYLQGWLPHPP